MCQVKLETAMHMDTVYKLRIKATTERLQVPFINAYYAGLFLRYQMNRYKNWESAVDSYNKGHVVDKNSQYVQRVTLALSKLALNN